MLNPYEGPLSAAEFPLFISAVATGFPSPADDFLEGTLDFNEYLVRHPAATFCVRVSGNSMIGAGIFPNDILVVDRSIKPNHGHVVIAALDGDLTVKRLMRENGRFFLFADNESFKPIEVKDGKVWVSSLEIARLFERQHKDVLESIRNLEADLDFIERNFSPNEYTDPRGRSLPMFMMTKKGYRRLVMDFTGKRGLWVNDQASVIHWGKRERN